MRIRKKPVEVTAERIDEPQTVETLEGTYEVTQEMVDAGYFVITGVKGECYPIEADILLDTYDPADETAEQVFGTLRSDE